MGVRIEILDNRAALVVTLTGSPQPAALKMLQEPLLAAAAEQKTLLLDITGVDETGTIEQIIESFGPLRPFLRIVHASSPATLPEPAHKPAGTYPSIAAALTADDEARSQSTWSHDELAAKYGILAQRYQQIITRYRQLLDAADAPAADRPPSCAEDEPHI